MKKNTKILIIISAAAVLLTGLMLLLIFMPKSNSQNGAATFDEGIDMSTSVDSNGVHQAKINTDENGNIKNNSYGTLIEYVPADISSIHIENSKGTLDITSETPKGEATVYTVKGCEASELQPGIADAIASAVSQIDFSEVVTLDKSRAKEFGFDKPRATATVTYNDKTKAVIILGNNAPAGAATFLKFGDGDAVYLVEASSVSALDYGLTDLISLSINDTAANTNNAAASSITLSGSAFGDTIELVPNTDGKVSASYKITTPNSGYASETESSLVEGAIRGLYAESVKMVNPSSAQISELGLSSPYAKIKAVYPDATVEIYASKPDSQGKVNLMLKNGSAIYTMDSTKLPWVTTSYEKLRSEYVLYPKLTALSSMSINDGKKTYVFDLASREVKATDNQGSETTSTTTTVKYGKKEIELSYFSTMLQNISMTKLADIKSESAGGTPVLSVTYTYASGGSDKVEFYSTGSNRYVASVNGVSVGHVYTAGINKILEQPAKVSENKQVDVIS